MVATLIPGTRDVRRTVVYNLNTMIERHQKNAATTGNEHVGGSVNVALFFLRGPTSSDDHVAPIFSNVARVTKKITNKRLK